VFVEIESKVTSFLATLPEKDRRIIGEHIDRLADHPHAHGYIEPLWTKRKRFKMHVSGKYVVFFFVVQETVRVDLIMTTEQAHKRYGRI